jgi:hypothetical protein
MVRGTAFELGEPEPIVPTDIGTIPADHSDDDEGDALEAVAPKAIPVVGASAEEPNAYQ